MIKFSILVYGCLVLWCLYELFFNTEILDDDDDRF